MTALGQGSIAQMLSFQVSKRKSSQLCFPAVGSMDPDCPKCSHKTWLGRDPLSGKYAEEQEMQAAKVTDCPKPRLAHSLGPSPLLHSTPALPGVLISAFGTHSNAP